MSQNVASASIDGTPFALWAGDVSVAAGAEWRREWMGDSWVDATSVRREWWAGNALPSKGNFNVKEAFLETVVPLAKDLPFMQSVDLQAAVRLEDYSTSGTVTAWKVGTTWKIVDSVTMRGSLSHDIRAPNLNELYSNGAGGAPFVTDPWNANANYGTTTQTVGNPLLTPELSDSWGAGIVFKPTFLPGFGASVDYWDTKIKDAIGSAGGLQTIVDNCFGGQTEYCSLITFAGGAPGGRIQAVKLSSVNNANAQYRGIDFESSYRFAVGFLPGDLSVRFLGTRYLENSNVSTTGIYTDVVGNNTGSVPKFRATLSANWSYADWSVGLSARGVSSGVYNKYYVECSSGCPISQPILPADTRVVTVNQNDIKGAVYFDGSLSKDIMFGEGSKANVFLNVRNLMNKDPAVVASSGAFSDTTSASNPALYDVLGRVFSAGVRVEF
jgi:outer membrane receptor protein involved in Fe transport